VKRYADTSFLVSTVIPDANHSAARAELLRIKLPPEFLLTEFGAFEARNTIRALTARRDLTDAGQIAALRLLRAMEAHAVTVAAAVPFPEWMRECERLSAALTPVLGTRALDVLHVAAARLMGASEFFSFDANQRRSAEASGLTVRP
jgi:predicted nucleic acid-binding protein